MQFNNQYLSACSVERTTRPPPAVIISIIFCHSLFFFSYALIAYRKSERRMTERVRNNRGRRGRRAREGYKYIIISYTACVYIRKYVERYFSYRSLSLSLSISQSHSLVLFLARSHIAHRYYRSVFLFFFFFFFFVFLCVLVSFIKC